MTRREPVAAVAQTGRTLGPRALQTRQRLLDATEELLRERSIMDISVVEIARIGETSPATFYHYFKDVEEAVLVLAEQAGRELPEAVAALEGSWKGRKGLDHARALSETFIDHWEKHHAVLLVRNLAADKGDERFQRVRREALSPVLDRLAGIIEASKSEGRIPSAMHPFLAAAALTAILERLSAHYRDLRTFEATREDLVETCSRIIYQTVTGRSID
jgi:AcrR family transcriptional regulator